MKLSVDIYYDIFWVIYSGRSKGHVGLPLKLFVILWMLYVRLWLHFVTFRLMESAYPYQTEYCDLDLTNSLLFLRPYASVPAKQLVALPWSFVKGFIRHQIRHWHIHQMDLDIQFSAKGIIGCRPIDWWQWPLDNPMWQSLTGICRSSFSIVVIRCHLAYS